jgi:hypothetical protein
MGKETCDSKRARSHVAIIDRELVNEAACECVPGRK